MKVLLDTHAVLWAAEGDARLGRSAEKILKSLATGEARISDISLLEITLLAKKKRIRVVPALSEYLRLLQRHFPILPITAEVAALSGEIPLAQGDPFDHVIVATALYHDLPLLTRDQAITASGRVRVIW